MEELNLDSILDEEAIGLFNDIGVQNNNNSETSEETTEEDKDNTQETTEVSTEDLFEYKPESVGSESEDNKEQKDTSSKSRGTSPKSDFFSSIAEALAEEGILPNLDEETIKNIKTPEDFRDAINDYIKSELDDQQKRVKEALDNNVEPDVVRQYEGVLKFLDNIDENSLKAEDEKGEDLRKRIIYQDLMNKGFSQEKATREVNRAFSNGTDLEDAIEALAECKNFYRGTYNKLLDEAKAATKKEQEARATKAKQLKDSILDTKNKFFDDGIELNESLRQKIYDNIAKPVYRDPNTGDLYTALQKYELDHGDDFLTKVGMLFTLTDGFKSLDKLVNSKVKKGIKRSLRDLEDKINNTARDYDGNLRFASGVEDEESYLGKGLRLAL